MPENEWLAVEVARGCCRDVTSWQAAHERLRDAPIVEHRDKQCWLARYRVRSMGACLAFLQDGLSKEAVAARCRRSSRLPAESGAPARRSLASGAF
jgi:hypothetical protein